MSGRSLLTDGVLIVAAMFIAALMALGLYDLIVHMLRLGIRI